MDLHYSSLYEKYQKLKMQKESEMEQNNQEQYLKFMNFVSAAENMIEHLKEENDRLHREIGELKVQSDSNGSLKEYEYVECQKLLADERQKAKDLAKDVEQLRSQLLERSSNNHLYIEDSNRSKSMSSPMDDQEDFKHSSTHGRTSLLNALLEALVGMKFSAVDHSERLSVSVQHQPTGYSFLLTWLSDPSTNEDGEWLYQVVSLGTLERVASDWMREDLKFSTTMCGIFFEKISRVIRGY